jgi:hypothetical protein
VISPTNPKSISGVLFFALIKFASAPEKPMAYISSAEVLQQYFY